VSSRRTYYKVRVAEVIRETADTVSLVLDVPPELAAGFRYQPGQFLTVRVPCAEGGSVARCYSLSSSPAAGDQPAITVKRMPDGVGSGWIASQVRAGTTIELLPPAGTFVPKSLDGDFLLIAAGSGITPVMSILKSALAAGRGRIALLYANADESSVIFAARLRELQAAAADRLTVVHWLDVLQGPPAAAALRGLARPYAGREVFLCGPDPFMAVTRQALDALGVRPARVHVERFLSLRENPFEETVPSGGTAAMLTVALDEQVSELDWPAGMRMLDVMIDARLDPPYSCREGICGACACRLVAGQVQMAHNEVLGEDDLADGHILACQSVALTPEVSIAY
jgi:3-ketosteroid 9alpha-monooxygenase subunit B